MSATFPTGRSGTSAVWDGTNAYIFGGRDGAYLNQIVRYNPGTNTVTTMGATLPSGRDATSAVWDGTNAYIFGGYNGASLLNQIVRYNPGTNTVTTMGATLPSARLGTSAVWDGTNAYIFGGNNGGGTLNQIVRYNPATNTVTTMSATLPDGQEAASAVWDGTSAYIFGGSTNVQQVNTIVRYNPGTNTVTTMSATFPTAHYRASAVWDGANAYIFGGANGGGQLDQIVRYNPGTNTVNTMGATLHTARFFASAVWDGANAYVFGGQGAGNQRLNQIVRYNPANTPPVITPTITGTLGGNGWYQSVVTVTWSVTADSAITSSSGCAASTVSSDTAGTTFTCTATSAGGTISKSVSVKRDATPPVLLVTRAPDANEAGWNNEAVTVTFACTDALSGVLDTSPATTLGEGADQSVAGSCTDNADNGAVGSVGDIDIDFTAPGVALSSRTPANAAGWNNEPAAVEWTCSDALSGPVAALVGDTKAAEGDAQSARATCADLADNTTPATLGDIRIDLTSPSVTGSRAPEANANGWDNGDVTVAFGCDDALSGVAALIPDTVLGGEGAGQSLEGTCVDAADNSASATVGGINIDRTPPVVTATRAPEANANGWNNGPVTVSFACSDALSGVAAVDDPVTLADEGADQGATGGCTDLADNAGSATLGGINIDLSAPEVSVALNGTAGKNGWWVSAVTATLTCTDALSGVPVGGITYVLDGAPGNDSGPVTINGDGGHDLDALCVDRADNSDSDAAAVGIDTAAPDGDVDSPLVALEAYDANWTAFDATSGVARVIVQERFLLGLLGDEWTDVCDVNMTAAGGANVTGACFRDVGPGQYCYRVVVEDEAGNVFTGDRVGVDDLLALDLAEILGCTVKATPEGLPDGPTRASDVAPREKPAQPRSSTLGVPPKRDW